MSCSGKWFMSQLLVKEHKNAKILSCSTGIVGLHRHCWFAQAILKWHKH